MRLIIALVIGSFICSTSEAQSWETIYTPVLTNLILYDINFPAGQNDIGYTVGSNVTYNGQGKVLKTTNGGLDWSVVWESNTNGTGMESVFFITTEIGFAGTMSGNIMKTIDGGTSWSSVDFAMGIDQGSIIDIEFYDANNGVLSSQWEGIYVTSNGGTTWTQATTNALSVYDLCYAGPTTLFAAQNGQDIQKSVDGGMTWTLSYNGPNMFGLNLGVHFSDLNNGLVTSEEGVVFVTHNGGDTWTQYTVPGQFGLMRGAWVVDADIMYATGTPGQVYVSTDGGVNWSDDSPLDFNPSYYKIIFTENGTGFVSGSGANGGTILRKGVAGGCTDPIACNYDPNETEDDGSCIYPDGCTDPTACNYDEAALCDDGTCILPDGCTDSEACNFDPLALCDDTSCAYADEFYDCAGNCLNDIDDDGICDELEIPGCTDVTSCNYDPLATDDDGSCAEPDGCTDITACNYDPEASCDDGSCLLPDGCTDSLACNFAPNALCDDGSCTFAEPLYDCDGNCLNDADEDGICDENEVAGCTDELACNFDPGATDDDGSCDYVEAMTITGATESFVGTEETYSYPDIDGSTYEWTVVGGTILSGQGTPSIVVLWNNEGSGSVSVIETNANDCEGPEVEITIDIATSISERSATNSFSMHPNPTRDFIRIEMEDRHSMVEWTITNTLGEVVLSGSLNGQITLDLSGISPGVYSIAVIQAGVRSVKNILKTE